MFNENIFQKITSHQEDNDIEKDPIIAELAEKIQGLARIENSIGKGMTAEVFVSKTNPDICYKIIHSDGEYNFRNSTQREGSLLAKATKISKNTNVKIPKPLYSIKTKGANGNELEILVMERIHAVSIKDLIEKNLDIAENFDFKKFAAAVENFFEQLHNQNVYHRDAHWGNIMIEKETNTPCIIDFGASIEMPINSEDPYSQTNFKNDIITFSKDEHRIRQELRINLRGYLFKKYGNKHNL